MEEHTVTFSDEEDELEKQVASLNYEGSLSKWTNYIHGWQSRWMVLSNGELAIPFEFRVMMRCANKRIFIIFKCILCLAFSKQNLLVMEFKE